MINAAELRIGNLFFTAGGIETVKEVLEEGICYAIAWVISDFSVRGESDNNEKRRWTYPYDRAEGIPINEEWLRKFGLEPIVGGRSESDPDYESTGWRAYYAASYMELGRDYFCIWDDRPSGFLMDNFSSAPLRYVHQLQNLYFTLTGSELQLLPK